MIVYIVMKLTLLKSKHANFIEHWSALSLMCIALTSNALSLCLEWGGICEDAFG